MIPAPFHTQFGLRLEHDAHPARRRPGSAEGAPRRYRRRLGLLILCVLMALCESAAAFFCFRFAFGGGGGNRGGLPSIMPPPPPAVFFPAAWPAPSSSVLASPAPKNPERKPEPFPESVWPPAHTQSTDIPPSGR